MTEQNSAHEKFKLECDRQIMASMKFVRFFDGKSGVFKNRMQLIFRPVSAALPEEENPISERRGNGDE